MFWFPPGGDFTESENLITSVACNLEKPDTFGKQPQVVNLALAKTSKMLGFPKLQTEFVRKETGWGVLVSPGGKNLTLSKTSKMLGFPPLYYKLRL